MKILKGRTIKEIRRDGDSLEFVTDGGSFVYTAEGDCCSVSWVEHLSNVEQLIGATVLEVEDIQLPVPSGVVTRPGGDEVDVLSVYGTKIVTNKGYGLLEYRNDSNGYYGGYMKGGKSEREVCFADVVTDDF